MILSRVYSVQRTAHSYCFNFNFGISLLSYVTMNINFQNTFSRILFVSIERVPSSGKIEAFSVCFFLPFFHFDRYEYRNYKKYPSHAYSYKFDSEATVHYALLSNMAVIALLIALNKIFLRCHNIFAVDFQGI